MVAKAIALVSGIVIGAALAKEALSAPVNVAPDPIMVIAGACELVLDPSIQYTVTYTGWVKGDVTNRTRPLPVLVQMSDDLSPNSDITVTGGLLNPTTGNLMLADFEYEITTCGYAIIGHAVVNQVQPLDEWVNHLELRTSN